MGNNSKYKFKHSLKKIENTAAFNKTANIKVIGVHNPSYTSAIHQLKGNSANLKKKLKNEKKNI